MAQKTCPKCNTQYGPRKKICDECGHIFIKQEAVPTPIYPEPGTWVLNQPKGFDTTGPPPELPRDRKLNLQEAQQHIAYEGLGFCIFSYIKANRIEDKKLAELWKKANTAMKEVIKYVEENQ
jgi:hypothetical protein